MRCFNVAGSMDPRKVNAFHRVTICGTEHSERGLRIPQMAWHVAKALIKIGLRCSVDRCMLTFKAIHSNK